MASPPDFKQISSFFHQAREYFRAAAAESQLENGSTQKWILLQKERLMCRLASQWQFIWKCHMYNVSPTHMTETGFQMSFSCALMDQKIKNDRQLVVKEIGSFIESCGLPYQIQQDDTVLTFTIRLGA